CVRIQGCAAAASRPVQIRLPRTDAFSEKSLPGYRPAGDGRTRGPPLRGGVVGEGPGPGAGDAVGADAEVFLGAADGDLGEADLAGLGHDGDGRDRAVGEDGLQVRDGVTPLGRGEAGIGGALVDAFRDRAQPADDATGIDVECDRGRGLGGVALDDLQDAPGAVRPAGVVVPRGDHQQRPGDGRDGRRADEAVGGTADRGRAWQADDAEDRDAGAADDAHERFELRAQVPFTKAVGAAQDVGEGIEDDEVDLVFLDDVADPPGLEAQVRPGAGGRLDEKDAAGIGAVGDAAGAEDADRVVVETEEEDVLRRNRGAVRQGRAGGEGGDEAGDEGGFAVADVAAEDGEHAGGNPAGPDPLEGLGGDGGEADG